MQFGQTEDAMAKTRSVSVRLSASELTSLMRERRITSQSALIQSLVSEDLERIRSHRAIREFVRRARVEDFDARLL
jgi:hypothetical protein